MRILKAHIRRICIYIRVDTYNTPYFRRIISRHRHTSAISKFRICWLVNWPHADALDAACITIIIDKPAQYFLGADSSELEASASCLLLSASIESCTHINGDGCSLISQSVHHYALLHCICTCISAISNIRVYVRRIYTLAPS
jgi:hypothetical protein